MNELLARESQCSTFYHLKRPSADRQAKDKKPAITKRPATTVTTSDRMQGIAFGPLRGPYVNAEAYERAKRGSTRCN
jgi:hypothetical protein